MNVGGNVLIIIDDILNDLTGAETEAEQKIVLINIVEKANEDKKYLPLLEEVADILFRRGQISLAFLLMAEIYELRSTAKNAFKIVKRLYQYEEYDKAYYQWFDLAKIANDNLEVMLYEGRLLNKLDFKSQAIEIYKNIIKVNPTYAQAYKDLADLLMDIGHYSEAETYYRAIFEYILDYEDIRDVRMKLVQLESWKEIFNLERIKELESHPNLPVNTQDEYFLFANVYAALHQYEVAIEYAKKALREDKDNINYSLLLIELYNIVGQESNLVKELTHVANALPDYDPIIIKLAKVAYNSNYLSEEIVDKLMNYSSLIDNYEDAYLISQIIVDHYLKQNDPATALYKLRIINDSLIDEEYLSYQYAQVFQALKNKDKVEEYYQIALDNLLPEDDLVYDYVNFLNNDQQTNQAISLAEKYKNTFYDNSKLKALRQELMANEKQNFNDAINIWEQLDGEE